jgi:CBS domain-containing protein
MRTVEDTQSGAPSRFDTVAVADAMHVGVITCPEATTLRTVAQMMAAYRVHAVVVFDEDAEPEDGALWGVVSDLDLVAGLSAGEIDERTAGRAAATPLVTVSADEPLERAAQLMVEHGTAHLVVLDPGSRLPVGVLSTLDLARVASGWEDPQIVESRRIPEEAR